MIDDPRVALVRERSGYASVPPFPPSEAYPEWPGSPIGLEDNPGFRAVRSALAALGLDDDRLGTPAWDPLSVLVRPGDLVMLKPNLVSHVNLGARKSGGANTDSLVTHGSVIRAALDYAAKALRGRGRIVIGDCPIQDTDWSAVVQLVGLDQIAADARCRFPGIVVDVKDYRLGRAIIRRGVMVKRVVEPVDPRTNVEVDLGADSLLMPIMGGKAEFGVSRYPRRRMRHAHHGTTNRYLIARDFLECDVLINLPKMKSHMKAGITCALKNLVGINSHKDYLPHFRYGSPKQGGDEYPDGNWFWDLMWYFRHQDWDRDKGVVKMLCFGLGAAGKQLLPTLAGMPKQSVAMGGGGWYGNDTLWRTVLDINRALFYFDSLSQSVTPQFNRRRYLAILDGLVGGHRESPLAPSPVAAGVMLAAQNPVALDALATALMGYNADRILQVSRAFELARLPLTNFPQEAVRVVGNTGLRSIADVQAHWLGPTFEPSRGFFGHVESQPETGAPSEPSDAITFAE